jgi:AcrR family transcriptional regulator
MIEEIKQIALRQLEVTGADLSLRAVSRELGMVSSAIYRYFPSRDDLLTALIIDGYNAMGAAAETAEAAVPRSDLRGRFVAVGRSLRAWAVAHPAEYALLYGSRVPGYQAPADTVGPAARAVVVLGDLLREAAARGRFEDEPSVRLPKLVRADLEAATRGSVFEGVPVPVVDRAVAAWLQLYGAISFELFGHLVGTIDHPEEWFEYRLRTLAAEVGL